MPAEQVSAIARRIALEEISVHEKRFGAIGIICTSLGLFVGWILSTAIAVSIVMRLQ